MSLPLSIDYHPLVADTYNTAAEQKAGVALATIADNSDAGQGGGYFAVPAGSANGVAIGVAPAGRKGVRFVLKPGDALTYVLAAAQPTAAPAAGTTITVSNPSAATMDWPEYFGAPYNLYIIGALTGTPQARFV